MESVICRAFSESQQFNNMDSVGEFSSRISSLLGVNF